MLQLALAESMTSLGSIICIKSWESYHCNQQFGENESINIRNAQQLRKEGNAKINKVSAMRAGLAKIIKKVRI
jgi:hypothetical protein